MFNLSLCLLNEPYLPSRAGLDGQGSSSYIDCVILRQRDANSGWTSAADGTLEERRYYCQNWRADVSAIITSGGLIVEWAKYTAYGVPIGLPGADTDSDGDCDSADITQIQTWIDAPAYDVRGDVDLDGDVDGTDKTLAQNNYEGTTSGWRVLSAAAVANRAGYAGYQKDVNLDISHVRNRVLDPHLGRWMRRDPLGYVEDPDLNLYEYVMSIPLTLIDPTGLANENGCGDIGCQIDAAGLVFGSCVFDDTVSGAIRQCLQFPNMCARYQCLQPLIETLNETICPHAFDGTLETIKMLIDLWCLKGSPKDWNSAKCTAQYLIIKPMCDNCGTCKGSFNRAECKRYAVSALCFTTCVGLYTHFDKVCSKKPHTQKIKDLGKGKSNCIDKLKKCRN